VDAPAAAVYRGAGAPEGPPNQPVGAIEFPYRFEVLEELASSEAEVLFRARDRLLDREVVLKAPGPGLEEAFRDKRTREIVLREARALARIQHPGIERLLDVLATRDGPVLVLEPSPGEPLAERLRREGPLAPDELLAWARKLGEALDAVHTAGLVHRGIESDHVFVTSDGPRLAGFRFAKDRREGKGPKPTLRYSATIGRVKALPAHPAPEQKLGQAADARTDLFSLGWVLHECATGAPPWTAKNPLEWRDPPDASTARPEIPAHLARASCWRRSIPAAPRRSPRRTRPGPRVARAGRSRRASPRSPTRGATSRRSPRAWPSCPATGRCACCSTTRPTARR